MQPKTIQGEKGTNKEEGRQEMTLPERVRSGGNHVNKSSRQRKGSIRTNRSSGRNIGTSKDWGHLNFGHRASHNNNDRSIPVSSRDIPVVHTTTRKLNGRSLQAWVPKNRSKGNKTHYPEWISKLFSVYVGGLGREVSLGVLWKSFSTFGVVVDAYIPSLQRRSRKGLGYGFVKYQKQQEAQKAVDSGANLKVLEHTMSVVGKSYGGADCNEVKEEFGKDGLLVQVASLSNLKTPIMFPSTDSMESSLKSHVGIFSRFLSFYAIKASLKAWGTVGGKHIKTHESTLSKSFLKAAWILVEADSKGDIPNVISGRETSNQSQSRSSPPVSVNSLGTRNVLSGSSKNLYGSVERMNNLSASCPLEIESCNLESPTLENNCCRILIGSVGNQSVVPESNFVSGSPVASDRSWANSKFGYMSASISNLESDIQQIEEQLAANGDNSDLRDKLYHYKEKGKLNHLDLLPRIESVNKCSSIWKNILIPRRHEHTDIASLSYGMSTIVGNGKNIKFWLDHWIGDGPLNLRFPRIFSLAVDKDARIADLRTLDNAEWRWSIRLKRNLFSWETEQWNDLQVPVLGYAVLLLLLV
ncbi:hypothetical protein COLO4_05373 [Corchorus olitorius]|uniref:RRM domain-containing protein n=1 Tax=Corchorus olitorius TaxID=93759 RepID=A0A1R3KR55_9ROSI|nr:hypothetical protein COLO4_05373 [Corchorus olitorius]